MRNELSGGVQDRASHGNCASARGLSGIMSNANDEKVLLTTVMINASEDCLVSGLEQSERSGYVRRWRWQASCFATAVTRQHFAQSMPSNSFQLCSLPFLHAPLHPNALGYSPRRLVDYSFLFCAVSLIILSSRSASSLLFRAASSALRRRGS
jgi:hypothetical protein